MSIRTLPTTYVCGICGFATTVNGGENIYLHSPAEIKAFWSQPGYDATLQWRHLGQLRLPA